MSLMRRALRNPDAVVRRVLGPAIERPYSRFLFANRFGAIPKKPLKSGKSPESGSGRMTNFPRWYTPGFRLIQRALARAMTWYIFPTATLDSFRQKSEKVRKIRKSPKIRTSNPDIPKPLWIEADIDGSFFIRHHTTSACQI